MDSEKQKMVVEYLQMAKKQNNITECTIRDEIALAISFALKSSDPNIQNFWKIIPCKGSTPTLEEIIDFIATEMPDSK